jgi:hypothetical protein
MLARGELEKISRSDGGLAGVTFLCLFNKMDLKTKKTKEELFSRLELD